MQLLPIEAVDAETIDGTMMQGRERADRVFGPHVTHYAGVAPRSSEANAAADAFMKAAVKSAGVNLAATTRVDAKTTDIGSADMDSGIEPTEMCSSAEPTHVAPAAESPAPRFRCGREHARRKKARGQNCR